MPRVNWPRRSTEQPAGFDPEWARNALRPFDPAGNDVQHPAIRAYRQFYRIEYEHDWPDITVSLGTLTHAGYRLALHHYHRADSTRGTVFVIHGYYDHVGIFDKVIRALLGEGYGVVCFDLPGHGLSSGGIAAIPDFHHYQLALDAVLQRLVGIAPQPWNIVGQSTGGAIIVDFLLRHTRHPGHIPFHRAVLLAPLVRPRGYGLGRYVHDVVSRVTDYITREFATNSHDTEFLHFLKYRDPLQSKRLSVQWVGALKKWVPDVETRDPSNFPLMIIQGQQDGTVEYEHNLVVLRHKFPKHELVLLPRARHQLANESAEIRAVIFAETLRFLDTAG